MLERAVQRLDHAAERVRDGLADRRPDDREQGVGERARVAPHRRRDHVLHGTLQRGFETPVVRALGDGVGQRSREVLPARDRVVEPGPERVDRIALGRHEQPPQVLQVVRRRRGAHQTPSVGSRNWLLRRIAISVKSDASAARSAFSSLSSPASRPNAASTS